MKPYWIEFWSAFFFVAGGIIGLGIVALFNIRTAKIVNRIQQVCREEQRDWSFWSDYGTKSKFLFSPDKLIAPEDSSAIKAAKQVLVKHRGTALRTVIFAGIAQLLGTILAAIVPIVVALTSS